MLSFSQQIFKNDIVLFGKVQSIITSHYVILQTDSFHLVEKEKMEFDTSGYIKESYRYDSKDQLLQYVLYDYDKTKLVKKIIVKDTSNNLVDSTISIYDNQGNESKVYRFNKNRKLILQILSQTSIATQTRDILFLDSLGKLFQKSIIKLNDSGKIDTWTNYGATGDLINRNVFYYDSIGRKIETNLFSNDSLLVEKNIYKYDNQGNEIENHKTVKKRPTVSIFKRFELDSIGNWVKMIVSIDENDVGIQIREIIYFH